jgi:hypothetical protein
MRTLRTALARPVDAQVLSIFRIAFGVVLAAGIARLIQKGFVDDAFVAPRWFFPPWPFERIFVPLGLGMYAIYGALFVLAIAIALGAWTRLAAGLFALLFTYAHFVDLTNYLNHYWLVTLLAIEIAIVAPSGVLAIDALRSRRTSVPAWHVWLIRGQLAVVYFHAGLAKLGSDWLLSAQPMRTWLAANTDVALIGPLLGTPAAAYFASWFGALYDLTIPIWLLRRRTRPFAFATVLLFHLATARLFHIGIFPYVMIAGSVVFFDRATPVAVPAAPAISRATMAALVAWLALQILIPLRSHLYGGNVLWHEQGYRFSWSVMRMEKMGSAEFSVVERATGVRRRIRLRDHLTHWQEKAIATQPDLILAFAHRLAELERQQGRDVAVHADVFVVLNGRPATRLIDEGVDLSRERDGFAPKRWIRAAPP